MASGIQVKMNSGGMAALLKSADVRNGLGPYAEAVLSAAIASAPVDTGEYVGSLHIEDDTTDRAVKRIVSDAPHAWIVEANTGNLARALDAAGGS